MSIVISALHANHGDAFVVKAETRGRDPFRILIDGGPAACYRQMQGFKRRNGPLHTTLEALSNCSDTLDLVILTHVDDDHIGGLVEAYKDASLVHALGNSVWFNSGRLIARKFGAKVTLEESQLTFQRGGNDRLTSIKQGVHFDDLLDEVNANTRELRMAGQEISFLQGQIQILSPEENQLRALLAKWKNERPDSLTSSHRNDYKSSLVSLLQVDKFEEDTAVHNASSISFLISSGNSKALFLGDAVPSTVCASLRNLRYSEKNPLHVGACKVSHHGSKGNTSPELLSLIRSDRFIISTDGSRHGLPNKVTLARILNMAPQSKIMFNYPGLKELIFSREELSAFSKNLVDIAGDIIL